MRISDWSSDVCSSDLAVGGAVLLAAAAIALAWANSAFSHSYHALWHTPLSFRLGSYEFAQPLHFWINDALMTVFFLVVGMEIRREIHEGAPSNFRQAALPLAPALGGVAVPARGSEGGGVGKG